MPSIQKYSNDSEFYMRLEAHDLNLKLTDIANNYLNTSSKPDKFQISWTTAKTLVYTGDLYHDVLSTREIIDLLPGLNPKACRMPRNELENLENQAKASMMIQGVSRSTFNDFSDFLRYETPLNEIKWDDMYKK